MQIVEPTTMLTDYVLAMFTLLLCGRLLKVNQAERQISVQLWIFALICIAVAAFLGGTSHGFALYLNAFAQKAIWKATVYVIGFASFFMLSGTIFATVTNPLRRWLLALTTLKLVLYGIWMIGHDDFSYVIYDYAPALVLVLILELSAFATRREPGAPWLMAGVLVSFAAAGVQLNGFAIHKHFNHNDLYHVIQMGAMYLFYRGIALLEDLERPAVAAEA